MTELTAIVINEMYRKNGIGLKAVKPEYNKYRENNVVRELSDWSFEDEFNKE